MNKIIISFIVSLLAVNLSFGQKKEIEYIESPWLLSLAIKAEILTYYNVRYTRAYYNIEYPMGDVPENIGCCTDVIIRAYRLMDIDLQQLVHEDMKANFDKYPKIWGLTKTDTNIDHRRVPNLMTFFERNGNWRPITNNPKDYKPGDIVCWNLGSDKHIGIVSNKKSKENPQRYMIIHNIGDGQVFEDCLFNWKIIGHYTFIRK